MRHRFEAWRRRLRLWTIPLAFCLVNAIGAAVYHMNFAGNVAALQGLVESASKELADLVADKEASLDFLDRVAERRKAKETLYNDVFSTKEKRFTDMVRAAKSLAEQAGLRPTSISYPEVEVLDGELSQRRITFPVEGTYENLRQFISFLELNDQFLTLERVSLSDAGGTGPGDRLSMQLELSTIFVEEPRRDLGGAR